MNNLFTFFLDTLSDFQNRFVVSEHPRHQEGVVVPVDAQHRNLYEKIIRDFSSFYDHRRILPPNLRDRLSLITIQLFFRQPKSWKSIQNKFEEMSKIDGKDEAAKKWINDWLKRLGKIESCLVESLNCECFIKEKILRVVDLTQNPDYLNTLSSAIINSQNKVNRCREEVSCCLNEGKESLQFDDNFDDKECKDLAATISYDWDQLKMFNEKIGDTWPEISLDADHLIVEMKIFRNNENCELPKEVKDKSIEAIFSVGIQVEDESEERGKFINRGSYPDISQNQEQKSVRELKKIVNLAIKNFNKQLVSN